MHVLLTNDDGPLDDKLCPYMKYFVDEIKRATDWKVSIVVPDQQRSWIGKAHFAGKQLTTTYIYTQDSTETPNSEINKFEGPFEKRQAHLESQGFQEWCLVDSTPAACADIGIHHLDSSYGPVDLVISGPNFGKNSGNLYMLASGTIGAAMEAVTHGTKAIALSYEFRSLKHSFDVLKEASKISVKLVAHLAQRLDEFPEIDLFSVNVPLISSLNLETTKIKYAPILENRWTSIYKPMGDGKYAWAPRFDHVAEHGLQSEIHTDSRVLIEDGISVTPLKAAFRSIEPFSGEIVLNNTVLQPTHGNVLLITIPEDSYIYKPVSEAFKRLGFTVETDKSLLDNFSANKLLKVFHFCDYEDVDLDLIQAHPPRYFVPTYIYRKALIRKHFLSNTIQHFIAKNPQSALVNAFPPSYHLQVDYAEFLDDSLDEAYELRGEIELGEKTWILKPSMSDKGQGIRIFNTVDQLQAIFDAFDEGVDTDDEEDDHEDNNGVIVSQLRHFIVQEYQSNPLLLSEYNNRKFHLRVYVLSVGDLKVFVYENILTLFAGDSYVSPSADDDAAILSLAGHLTNTCLQDGTNPLVVPFWDLEGLTTEKKAAIFEQIKEVTGALFKAASTVDKINFQPMVNSAEIFGVDFLVNEDYSVKLLEVNSYPDFKQTGAELKQIIYDLFTSVAESVAEKFEIESDNSKLMHQVL
ncbi:hypothetical protein PUMCH_001532 [Australozyma saopauloensis]|uniref:ATP-grasp domain-containing protein n=1 Tax=Australozyma saopauloensis TaxID=291208 RepID=A0AAX4H6S3_9ASCO|nr:hypothetical protein PUMCH_001532 [[Candida] saopauloensis]